MEIKEMTVQQLVEKFEYISKNDSFILDSTKKVISEIKIALLKLYSDQEEKIKGLKEEKEKLRLIVVNFINADVSIITTLMEQLAEAKKAAEDLKKEKFKQPHDVDKFYPPDCTCPQPTSITTSGLCSICGRRKG